MEAVHNNIMIKKKGSRDCAAPKILNGSSRDSGLPVKPKILDSSRLWSV